ncbi:MAG: hypothetical protein L7S63_07745, partial [Flavobacteriales bacterium]|nr:hypothetical protein [Flavobacteriales bacterium]
MTHVDRHETVLTTELKAHVERNRQWVEETFPAFEKLTTPLVLFEQLRAYAEMLESSINSLTQFVHQTGRNEYEAAMRQGSPTAQAPMSPPPVPGSVDPTVAQPSPMHHLSATQPTAAPPSLFADGRPQAASAPPSFDYFGQGLGAASLPTAAPAGGQPSMFKLSPGGPPTQDAQSDPLQQPQNDTWGQYRARTMPTPCPAATSVPMPSMQSQPTRQSQPYNLMGSQLAVDPVQRCASQGVPPSWNIPANPPSYDTTGPGFTQPAAPGWNPAAAHRFNQHHRQAEVPFQQNAWQSAPHPQSAAPCPARAHPGMPGPASHFGQMQTDQFMGDQKAMHRKSDSLRRFTGTAENFGSWTGHMIDHMGKVHPCWRQVLNWLAATDDPLDFPSIQHAVLGPFNENARDLAIKFEQVIVDWIPEKLYLRRAQLAGGKHEEGNGFAMWRRLHKEFRGEGQIIDYAGTTCLREYGRCKQLKDVSQHIDGWYELFDQFGKELEHAHHMTRGMFLDIIPQELRTEILKEPKLNNSGHRALAEWCRNRVLILTSEHLAEVRKKELTARGKIGSLQEAAESSSVPDMSDSPDWARHLFAAVQPLIAAAAVPPVAAIQAPPRRPTGPGRRSSPQRSRSPGSRVSLVPDWGNKCFHCGSDKHTREKCDKFKAMLKSAACNQGKPESQWKPPEGYKSAIGKARDAARALLG